MAAPITPTTPNVDGKPITVFINHTSTGADENSVDLNIYNPLIDLRIGHPVLSGMVLYNTANTDLSDSEVIAPNAEMARGTAADTAKEWRIVDANTIAYYQSVNKNSVYAISYIAFGSQQA